MYKNSFRDTGLAFAFKFRLGRSRHVIPQHLRYNLR